MCASCAALATPRGARIRPGGVRVAFDDSASLGPSLHQEPSSAPSRHPPKPVRSFLGTVPTIFRIRRRTRRSDISDRASPRDATASYEGPATYLGHKDLVPPPRGEHATQRGPSRTHGRPSGSPRRRGPGTSSPFRYGPLEDVLALARACHVHLAPTETGVWHERLEVAETCCSKLETSEDPRSSALTASSDVSLNGSFCSNAWISRKG